ncbi:VCBS repeat-containing protein [Maribacter polysiphoniae]|uniref:VCBS repeat-containing protein n=1 Tax=Maribacter polysiphoniae TaxID=429344 RepID=UPI00235525F9|nr:VCBS repeat-containing protein [Maribacter polysiphoniae]
MTSHHNKINTLLRLHFIGLLGLLAINCSTSTPEKRLFELVDSEHSNIDFENRLSENDTINILDFEFMFNGGGVAIGDIDNDGLQDLYFSGNQVSGKLYRNLGDFKFKDITAEANVVTTGWCNGVAMKDINQDGFLDLYISRGGPRNTPEEQMANLLFLNRGDGTFVESANEYGLADTGYSIQALFLDYDKDGDNDMYLLTNALVAYNRNTSRPKIMDGKAPSTDRLYKNNGDNTFTDISKEAGVTIEGFGLGVSVCDINKDGWLDIYVSNDFLTNDILYVNNGDGTFSDKIFDYLKHQSYNGMGLNIADINNDAQSDIIVLDMLPQDNKRLKQTLGYFSYDKHMLDTEFGYMPQYVRNTLQLNNGDGSFSEIGQLSGINATDWSWSPLIADFDNDGFKDVFITNGYRRDVTNLDFIVYGQKQGPFGDPETIRKDKLQKLNALPEVKLHNYIYKNNGGVDFTDKSLVWGIDTPSYSNGSAYADLDNDGDLDLAINNIDDKAHIYKNNTIEANTAISGNHFIQITLKGLPNVTGTEVYLYDQNTVQYQYHNTVKGYLSTMGESLHFGLGDTKEVDSLTVKWPNGKCQTLKKVLANQTITLDVANAGNCKKNTLIPTIFQEMVRKGINYTHREEKHIDFNEQTTLIQMNSRLGPGIAVGDINADGIEDFYVGGGKGQNGSFFIQQNDGGFLEKPLLSEETHEDMGTLLFDIDGDGDLDLLVISGGENSTKLKQGYTDRVYLNDGQANFKGKDFFTRPDAGSFVKAGDYDKDGDLDLFIGGRYVSGSYPLSPNSYLLKNENGQFHDVTQAVFNNERKFGMLTDALWTDFDNDGWLDLIIVAEFSEPLFYKNDNGNLINVSKSTGLENCSGWWNSINSGDFDKDGDTDYILGNLGLNSAYKASAEEPVTIYAKDFDANGTIDPMITCYRQGNEHLIHSRDVLNSQIVAMKGRFRTYEAYANAPFDRTFSKKELKDAYTLKATMLTSMYMENMGEGKFKMKELPIEAQYAPIFGTLVEDFNGDDNIDVLLVGNLYATEALTGAYDALSGLCLLGDGIGGFLPVKATESGLKIDGDAKGLVELGAANGDAILLASQNLGELKAYSYTTNKLVMHPKPRETHALVHMKDGSSYKKEFAYGSSYLSHTSRQLKVDKTKTDYIEFFSYTNQTRKIEIGDDK